MFATPNSSRPGPARIRPRVPDARAPLLCLGLLLTFAHLARPLSAAETNSVVTQSVSYRERLNQGFSVTHTLFLTNTNDATNAWQFGRACFDLGQITTNNAVKTQLAEQGIAACRQAILCQSNSAPAHYYLAMTIGQYADTKRNLAALRMVKEMEREFKVVLALDEQFNHAGADRSLGLLYYQTPSIISIGSNTKARQHLRRAVELAPEFPENRLNLVETLLELGDDEDARQEFMALEKLLPTLKEKFPGERWDEPPAEWQQRFTAVKTRVATNSR